MESPVSSAGAESLKVILQAWDPNSQLPLTFSLQETRGSRNSLLILEEWIFFLFLFIWENKFLTHVGGKPKWYMDPTDPEGALLCNMHKLSDLTLDLTPISN